MQEIFNTLVFSFIQGVLEFLPISSSAHLKIASNFLNIKNAEELKVFLELATFFCVLFYFRNLIIGQVIGLFSEDKTSSFHFFAKVLLACLPFAFVLPFVGGFYSNVSLFLVLGSVLMVISEFLYKRKNLLTEDINSITYKQSLLIGCFQIFSVFSGFSRSGSTICGGLVAGLSKPLAVRFSFLISLPVSFSAIVYNFYSVSPSFNSINLLGFFACLLVACIAIKPCLNLVSRLSLNWFAGYRVLLALLLLL